MRRSLMFIMVCFVSVVLYGQTEGYDIYLMIGQSNMAGRGSLEQTDTTQIVEGVWLLDSAGVPVKACAPFNRYSSIRKDIKLQGYSPANNFSKLMRSRSGRNILLVVNAKGGSAIDEWQPGDKHRFFDEAVRRTNQAMKYGTLKGILWHQGETNVMKGTPNYIDKFTTFITALRDTLNSSDIPVVMGQLGQWGWNTADKINAFNDSVIPAICNSVNNCHYVSSHRLGRLYKNKERDPHFSREAQIELGRRYADAMTPLVDSIYVTKFRGNKKSAMSFTFDDGDLDHALLVAPELEKRGFLGTFWINGKKIENGDSERPRMSWSQLRDMSLKGHEISNHSWSHGKLVLMTPEDARKDIEMNDSAIALNVGKRPVSFCYPFNATRSWLVDIAEEGRVGSRLHQKGIGQQNNKMTPEKLTAWVDEVVATGDWGVTMTHGITTGYDKWHNPQELWDMFDYVKSREDDIWVATFKEIAAYRAERDNVVLKKQDNGKEITITADIQLDKTLFNEPITVAIKGNWFDKKISVVRNDEKVNVNFQGDLLLFEMIPVSDSVKISLK